MPTRNVNFTAGQDAFVEDVVRAGRYQNASEAIRDAVRGLQQRLQADELKLELPRAQVRAGLNALEHGAFTEVDDAALDATLDGTCSERQAVNSGPLSAVRTGEVGHRVALTRHCDLIPMQVRLKSGLFSAVVRLLPAHDSLCAPFRRA
jgi:antitoxin ParD1/3/4